MFTNELSLCTTFRLVCLLAAECKWRGRRPLPRATVFVGTMVNIQFFRSISFTSRRLELRKRMLIFIEKKNANSRFCFIFFKSQSIVYELCFKRNKRIYSRRWIHSQYNNIFSHTIDAFERSTVYSITAKIDFLLCHPNTSHAANQFFSV